MKDKEVKKGALQSLYGFQASKLALWLYRSKRAFVALKLAR